MDVIGEANVRPIETSGGETLYRHTLEKFQHLLAKNRDKAFRQFGMTMFHSLPEDKKTRLREAWGINPQDATTHYNLGVIAASEGNWAKAIERFSRAFEMDATLLDALYNLALATEKKGETKEARELFERYVSLATEAGHRPEDIEKAGAHIKELNEP